MSPFCRFMGIINTPNSCIMNIQGVDNMYNPNMMNMMLSMLRPNQRDTVNRLQGKSREEQAQEIANYCNQNGISRDKLQSLINMFRR